MDHGKIMTIRLGEDDSAPRFAFVRPSLRTVRELLDIVGTIKQGADQAGAFGALGALLKRQVRNWANVTDVETGEPLPYEPQHLERAVDMDGVMKIAGQLLGGGDRSETERKKSESPLSSGAAVSAPGAEGASPVA